MDSDDPQQVEVRLVKLNRLKKTSSEDILHIRSESINLPQSTEDKLTATGTIEPESRVTEGEPSVSTPVVEISAENDLGLGHHNSPLTSRVVSPASASEIEVFASSHLPTAFPRTLAEVLGSEPQAIYRQVASSPEDFGVLLLTEGAFLVEGWRGRIELAQLEVLVDGHRPSPTHPDVVLDQHGKAIAGAVKKSSNGLLRVIPLKYRDGLLLKFIYKSAGWTRREFRRRTVKTRLELVTIYDFRMAMAARMERFHRAS